jgi:hypothetical protein
MTNLSESIFTKDQIIRFKDEAKKLNEKLE